MKKTKSLKEKWNHFLRKELKPLSITILLLFAFRSAIADWNDVPSGSMKPTIIEGDRVYVNKLAYDLKVPFTQWHLAEWDNPHRGEIVVFFSPADGQRLVKRVIGVPGDVIELRDDRLFVNGEAVQYEPLAAKFVNAIPTAEQPQHQFATEELAKRPHPVMATPMLRAPRTFGPITVPAGKYFMMGDNRDNSFDSRFYGCVDRKAIVGRASAVVISMDHSDYFLPRWHRFFTALP
ncbi:MAG TPA: signal peptidase I [Verrucomicrobiae bacterium]|nr:signal peptidase I [Verrucomicrobiae bacterium]